MTDWLPEGATSGIYAALFFIGLILMKDVPADLLRRYRELREARERRRARINAEESRKVKKREQAETIIRMYQPSGIEYEATCEKDGGK